MRWLGVFAVILVGGAIYLYLSLSEGSAKPPRSNTGAVADREGDTGSSNPSPAPSKDSPPAKGPVGVPRSEAKPAPTLAPSPSGPSGSGEVAKKRGPAELGDPDVPWTEPERQQWLWTAGGRFAKGNYPGALEASLEIARRNPGSAWEQDAWSIAIKSYCAMSEPEKANALFGKMTDQTGTDDALKGCAEWNVKLTKSP